MPTPTDPSELFAALYSELRAIAGKHVREFHGSLSLSTTALLHEAYLNMADGGGASFPDRAHFLAYASKAMRGIIIDYSRNRKAKKRGGEFHFTTLGTADVGASATGDADDELDLEQLGRALDQLSEVDPRLTELVDLHFFCGFTFAEIAEQRAASERTVMRDWRKARLILGQALGKNSVS